MDILPVLNDLAALPLSEAVRTWPWAYPLLETIHVIGLSLVFGGIFLLDLRLLGVGRALPLALLSHHILPWVWAGFALNILSGVPLFLSDAATFGINIAFRIKMILILVAGLNALWFQFKIFPNVQIVDAKQPMPGAARLSALLSLTLWALVIAAGRMIAYSP